MNICPSPSVSPRVTDISNFRLGQSILELGGIRTAGQALLQHLPHPYDRHVLPDRQDAAHLLIVSARSGKIFA